MKKYKNEFDFYYTHKDSVSLLFGQEYHRMFDEMYIDVKHNMDFAFYIGIPLVALWMIWSCYAPGFGAYYSAGIVVLLGLIIRWHCKFISKLSCKYFFEKKKLAIIEQFIAPFIDDELREDPKNEDAIRKFYNSCKWQLLDVHVDIHHKPKV